MDAILASHKALQATVSAQQAQIETLMRVQRELQEELKEVRTLRRDAEARPTDLLGESSIIGMHNLDIHASPLLDSG